MMQGFEHLGVLLIWLMPVLLLAMLFLFHRLGRAARRRADRRARLDARLADGEIDLDEYLKRRAEFDG